MRGRAWWSLDPVSCTVVFVILVAILSCLSFTLPTLVSAVSSSSSSSVARCSLESEVRVLCELATTYPWLWAEDPCNFSVPCPDDGMMDLDGVQCFSQGDNVPDELVGHIKTMDLTGTIFLSQFPECIVDLCYIKILDMSDTLLEGELPSSLGDLCSLQQLDLSDNDLLATIPISLGLLRNLIALDLSNNFFSGAIPATIYDISSLILLDLSQNGLSGLVSDAILKLTAMTTLDFSRNQLAGSIPSFQNMGLSSINLQNNRFAGVLSTELGSLIELQYLDMSLNQIYGTIPSELGNLISLLEINLSNNDIEGSLPAPLLALDKLQYLNVENNELTGTIPSTGESLTYLDVSGNHLGGSLPSSLGTTPSITFLDLSDNQLSGPLPEFSSLMTLLTAIHFGTNEFSGTIPQSIGHLSALQYLCLPQNQLMGTIPSSFGELRELLALDCSYNQLTGTIPTQLGSLPSLMSLDFSANQLQGTLPPELGQLAYLQLLSFEHNELGGEVPLTLSNLTILSTLKLASNLLSGNSSVLTEFFLTVVECDVSENCVNCVDPYPCMCNLKRETSLCECVTQSDPNDTFLGCYIDGECYGEGENSGCARMCNTSATQLDWYYIECVPWIFLITTAVILIILISSCAGIMAACFFLRNKRKKKCEEQQRLLSINSDKYTPSVHVEQFPLCIKPQVLTLGLGSNKAPIGTPLQESIILANKHRYAVVFACRHEPSDKFDINFDPPTGLVRQKDSFTVTITVTFHCTTRSHIQVIIEAGKEGKSTSVCTQVKGNIETKLSTRLDFDDIQLKQPPIGIGGFGVVYKGLWRENDVAVKVLKYPQLHDTLLEKFMREIQMMEDIRSIYCVTFIGAVTTPGKLCIVTEFCEFGSLASVLKKYLLCYCLKVKMACDAAKGMHYLHSNGIIHRDFKPDNLLVTAMTLEAPVSCKITDFGTTRDVNESDLSNKYTLGLGTAQYLAPELILPTGDTGYNKACDVFSYGVTLYELYVNGDAYPQAQFKTIAQVSKFILEGKRMPIPETCPDGYDRLVTECWEQDPCSRPSFSEIEDRLKAQLDLATEEHNTTNPQPPTFTPISATKTPTSH